MGQRAKFVQKPKRKRKGKTKCGSGFLQLRQWALTLIGPCVLVSNEALNSNFTFYGGEEEGPLLLKTKISD